MWMAFCWRIHKTAQLRMLSEIRSKALDAIEVGYRSIDTAQGR